MSLTFSRAFVECFLLLLCLTQCQTELFTAMVGLSQTMSTEDALADRLYQYLAEEEDRLLEVLRLADNLREHAQKWRQIGDPEKYLSNPINAFLLIKRYALKWHHQVKQLLKRMTEPVYNEILEDIDRLNDQLPNHEDLVGSAEALLRLQDTYRLSTKAIASGNVYFSPNSSLTAQDCMYIASQAYNNEKYTYCKEWMEEALDRALDGNNDDASDRQADIISIYDYLAFASYKLGDIQEATRRTNDILAIDPNHERAALNKVYFEENKKNFLPAKGDTEEWDGLKQSYYHERNKYEAMCRGETLISVGSKLKQALVCRYHVPHPYYLIGPIREEILFHQPRIVLWHHVLYDSEIETIKNLSVSKFQRATVQNAVTGKLEFAHYRISQSAWLVEDLNELTLTINKRIRIITGLDSSTAEDLQVVNYGIGGQYEPHFDFAHKRERSSFEKSVGNRIATLIFYLSAVEAGGSTVFTELGINVVPVRGAAVFWWNLNSDGSGDLRTRHAACPVLYGSKWVMNKWFHERGQEFRRPCNPRDGPQSS